ncbi:unnamed protein product [Fraxinus pennsylvanica]|uniref:Uncharacterized protein n=1 Tax=Fraxinus pennsylvanica TaxID=56036 RepID=A0AAD1ZKL7_9LAMI|nr:unnamed protein product [Fraxinus pennsylvanica]
MGGGGNRDLSDEGSGGGGGDGDDECGSGGGNGSGEVGKGVQEENQKAMVANNQVEATIENNCLELTPESYLHLAEFLQSQKPHCWTVVFRLFGVQTHLPFQAHHPRLFGFLFLFFGCRFWFDCGDSILGV